MDSAASENDLVLNRLAEEFAVRFRRGERPSIQEYVDRYPELADEIRDFIPAVVKLEQAKDDREAAHDAAAAGAPPIEKLGDFHLLREVGRGGMGVVYEAEQESLGRRVALKVLSPEVLRAGHQKQRFEREARAAAKLHHTNIVPVFGFGEHDGVPYYVMQFIEGLGLDQVITEIRQMGGGLAGAPPACAAPAPRESDAAGALARSLVTGRFGAYATSQRDGSATGLGPGLALVATECHETPDPEPGAANAHPLPATTPVPGPGSGVTPLVSLPGQSAVSGGRRARRVDYWHSIARVGTQVAGALAYAHSQGILHRDIKPSNLLLDQQGTVWVADFGLAKSDDQEDLTHTGDILGTLRYMPPEAFDGKFDTRGDIYSLGLTLFELLALRPAFDERERNRLIKQVTTGAPPRLRKLRTGVPRDLETIIEKAIDRDPARRYATAAELGADLERFRDDDPIHARHLSTTERLWRWSRRNPAIAALATTVLMLLFGITAASVVAAAHFDALAKRETRTAAAERVARQAAQQARQRESMLRARTEQALAEAEAQRQQAQANFAKARAAVDDYLTRVSESQLLEVPGMQPLRRELLHSAGAFYQDFLKEHSDDPAVKAGLASAYLRLGRIQGELGERAPGRAAFEQALSLYAELLRSRPDDVELLHGKAQSLFGLGQHEPAIAIWRALVKPDQPRFQKELAQALNNIGQAHRRRKELAQSLAAQEEALAIRETLARLRGDDPLAEHDLGQTFNNIGVLLFDLGRKAEARAVFLRAIEHHERAMQRAPSDWHNDRGAAITIDNIAHIQHDLGDRDDGVRWLQKGVALWRRVAGENPAVPELHSRLVGAYRTLSRWQNELAQTADAARSQRLALETIERLPAEGPEALFNLACVRAGCAALAPFDASARVNTPGPVDGRSDADLAVDALKKAIAAGFDDAARLKSANELDGIRQRSDFQSLVAGVEAMALAAAGQASASARLKANQQVLALRRELLANNPRDSRLRAAQASSQHAIGLIQLDLARPRQAAAALAQAAAVRQRLVKEEPGNVQYHADLAESCLALAAALVKSGKATEAMTERSRGLDEFGTAVALAPQDPQLAARAREAEGTVVREYARGGLWSEAAPLRERSFARPLPVPFGLDWYDQALLQLLTGNVAGYRTLTSQLGPSGASAVNRLEFIRIATLSPESLVEPARLVEASEARTRLKGYTEYWYDYAIGLAYYRAGRYEEAAARLVQIDQASVLPVVLAMAQHRLGRRDEARRLLRTCDRAYEAILRTSLAGGGRELAVPFWETAAAFELLRREAGTLIEGRDAPNPPLRLLQRARAYAAIGLSEKAGAELQADPIMRCEDAAVWLARGRIQAELGQSTQAEADFARAAAFTSEDSLAWIVQGRYLAEQGRASEADLAFARAAAQTPQELNRFLEAGWWAVGPYPADAALTQPYPPEFRADPAKPAAPAAGPDRLTWRSVPADAFGKVDLGAVFQGTNRSVYALAYVYAPEPRPASLLFGAADKARIWLNGRLEYEPGAAPARPDLVQPKFLDRIPVSLRAGRNTLLVQVTAATADCSLRLRIGDSPFDRGFTLAELGLWDEAKPLFERAVERTDMPNPASWGDYLAVYAASGDLDGLRRIARRTFDRFGKQSGHLLVASCSLAPGVLTDASRLVEAAGADLAGPRQRLAAGLARHRAGRDQEALPLLRQAEEGGDPRAAPALALTENALGNAAEARRALERATSWYDAGTRKVLAEPGLALPYDWHYLAHFVVLYAEAREQVEGSRPAADPNLAALQARARAALRALDPATYDHDLAILFSPGRPELYRARARRRFELGRDQQAEADLARALALDPDKAAAWRQCGVIHGELGQSEKAAAAFVKALERLPAGPNHWDGRRTAIDDALVRRDDVFSDVVRQRPDDIGLWQARLSYFSQRGRTAEAAAAATRLTALATTVRDLSRAASACIRAGDREGYRAACRRILTVPDSREPWFESFTRALVCLAAPAAVDDLDPVLKLAEQAPPRTAGAPVKDEFTLLHGLAAYRKGKFARAAELLDPLANRADHIRLVGPPAAILAMAQHRLGQRDDARKALKRERVLFERERARVEEGQVDDRWIDTGLWVALLQEAEALLGAGGQQPTQ
jgi:tetratricopeptide (TPR) repeat protein